MACICHEMCTCVHGFIHSELTCGSWCVHDMQLALHKSTEQWKTNVGMIHFVSKTTCSYIEVQL